MKRAQLTTRSKAARTCARPCPVSTTGNALLTLLDDADVTVGQLCASTSALASLTVDLVARNNESIHQAIAQVTSSRSALLTRKTRVLGSAKRLSRKQCKRIVADNEAADVSTEQLRVWASFAGAGQACPDLECVFAALSLLASPRLLRLPATGMSSILGLPFVSELGSVDTGDGLRVVSAAGPGLKWFERHSRNEFSVVLVQADGSAPVWLTASDVLVTVLSTADASSAARVSAGAASGVRSARQDTVRVVYGCLSEDAPEAVLQLSVCGTPVADAAGDRVWCVRVPRKPLAAHECAAAGVHVRTLAVVRGDTMYGTAVSVDEKWLVVGMGNMGTLSVYSLPGGELVRTFGGRGDGPLQFADQRRLCFAPNGNLIVVDQGNKRLQEVTLEGVFVRFIGVGEFSGCQNDDDDEDDVDDEEDDDNYDDDDDDDDDDVTLPFCVAVHDDLIAAGCHEGTGPRVVLFEFGTSVVISRFGEVGTALGQISFDCSGIRFSHDGSHVIVAEWQATRLSVFTTAGVFVRCVGVGVLGRGSVDVLQSVAGEYVVADVANHRVCVFSPDGSELVRSWGVRGAGDGQFEFPIALAAAGQHLYVMDRYNGRVQVFE